MSRLGKVLPQLHVMGCPAAICAARPPPPSLGTAAGDGMPPTPPMGLLLTGSIPGDDGSAAWPRAAAATARSGGGGIISEDGDGIGEDDETVEGVNDDREHVRAIMGKEERRKGGKEEGGLIIRTISCSNGRENGEGGSGYTAVLGQVVCFNTPPSVSMLASLRILWISHDCRVVPYIWS